MTEMARPMAFPSMSKVLIFLRPWPVSSCNLPLVTYVPPVLYSTNVASTAYKPLASMEYANLQKLQ